MNKLSLSPLQVVFMIAGLACAIAGLGCSAFTADTKKVMVPVLGAGFAIAAGLSAIGIMHSYRFLENDTAMQLGKPAWEWAIGYAIMGSCFLVAKWVTEPTEVVR